MYTPKMQKQMREILPQSHAPALHRAGRRRRLPCYDLSAGALESGNRAPADGTEGCWGADHGRSRSSDEADDGALVLENKIQVSETGLKNPALNQREPYVELIDGTEKLLLTNDGIYRTEK